MVAGFEETVRRLATAGLALLDCDQPLLCRCVEFLKWVLEERYDDLAKTFHDTPMMQAYQGDASPTLVRQRWMHKIGLSTYKHEVVKKVDWYSMRAYLSTVDAEDRVHTRALLRDPVCLPNKEHWTLFGVTCGMVPTLRQRGARNFVIHYWCWDRGEFADQYRWARARSVCEHADIVDDIEKPFLALASWDVGLGCAGHDGHNAQVWSMFPHTPDARRLSKDLWVAVQSLRNSFEVVAAHVPLIVQDCIFGHDSDTDERWERSGKRLGSIQICSKK